MGRENAFHNLFFEDLCGDLGGDLSGDLSGDLGELLDREKKIHQPLLADNGSKEYIGHLELTNWIRDLVASLAENKERER